MNFTFTYELIDIICLHCTVIFIFEWDYCNSSVQLFLENRNYRMLHNDRHSFNSKIQKIALIARYKNLCLFTSRWRSGLHSAD